MLTIKMEVKNMTVKIQYPSRNTKQMTVTIGNLDLYFSYETLVAFNSRRVGFWISKNIWSTTTGRHLNEIHPDHSIRSTPELFDLKVKEMLKEHRLE